MNQTSRRLLLPLVLLLPVSACGGGKSAVTQRDEAAVPLYDNLGTHHYEVTTTDTVAQRYFDQGLRLYYAFNHGEAIRSFEAASRLDPRCAMCFWGTALAYGPNINLPMDSASGIAAYTAVQQALAVRSHGSAKEQALIDALATRYAAVPPADRAQLDTLYARAMGEVAARFPDDPEVGTLYAEALMDLSPWQYWDRDGSPRPDTPELLAQLEAVLAVHPDHPGANHFFIHAVEAVDPHRAVPMAERLAGLMPGAGHLVHMPGHIYVRVGRYMDAIRANEHAVHADESWIRDHNPGLGIYTLGYYPHNYDFLAFAASMIGRSRQALDAADRMVGLIPEEMLRAPGLTLLQNSLSRGLQMRVRFGKWDEILAAPPPATDLPYARGIWHYARGRALAAGGDVEAADSQLALLRAAAVDPALHGARLEFNPAPDLLAIAAEVLAGHAAAARGDMQDALAALRRAVVMEDGLVYGEPPEWSVPVRQELGAMLLIAGRAAEGEAVFREDLQRFPENGWSLHGLARSLEARGFSQQAASVQRRFAESWSSADFDLNRRP
jgi:tetratricopeptide (TPR) repeat protein